MATNYEKTLAIRLKEQREKIANRLIERAKEVSPTDDYEYGVRNGLEAAASEILKGNE